MNKVLVCVLMLALTVNYTLSGTTITGQWEIYGVLRSSPSSFTSKFTVEIGQIYGNSNIDPLSASASSQYVQNMREKASSSTWSKKELRTITVSAGAGQTLVLWQYVFKVNNEKYKSDILAETDSMNKVPK